MNRLPFVAFLFFLLPCPGMAQSDNYPGTWQMEYRQSGVAGLLTARLEVAAAELKMLYPAKLTIQCDSFHAVYEMLLLKKGSRELGISKNKFAREEKPFSLNFLPFFVNGNFDYSRSQSGKPLLTLNRLPLQTGSPKQIIPANSNIDKSTALKLVSFFTTTPVVLEKLSDHPWRDGYSERITTPALSPAYFGITDTVHVKTRDGLLQLSGGKKDDVVSVIINGKLVADRVGVTKKAHTEDVLLDTGLNLVVLYAEAFGNDLPSEARMKLELGKKQIALDFQNRGDSAACFIVAQIYCERDEEKDIYFADYNPFANGGSPLKQNEKFLGSLASTSRQLTLAIWDDAVEDGDSISININGDWIARGFPVKKKTQFITVTLKPGANTINFIADNLGNIAPNTSILEIIDGRKRKSFSLETVLGESNLLKIRYDVQSP